MKTTQRTGRPVVTRDKVRRRLLPRRFLLEESGAEVANAKHGHVPPSTNEDIVGLEVSVHDALYIRIHVYIHIYIGVTTATARGGCGRDVSESS